MENLRQIGKWSTKVFYKEHEQIGLYMRLTRKNLNALSELPFSDNIAPGYGRFCSTFVRMEHDFRDGITEPIQWAKDFFTWADTLTRYSELL